MAYNTQELIDRAIELLKDKELNLMFIEDIACYLGISVKTFYAHELHESNAIKELLLSNKVKTKNGLRSKWYKSNNPTSQIALYKLLADDFEYARLNNNPIVNNITNNLDITDDYMIEVVKQLIKENPNLKAEFDIG